MSDLLNEPGPAVRLRLAAEEKNVWLCTVRPDGSAHVTPVWFVYQNSRWWIGLVHGSVKVRNIGKEPRVSLALEDGRFPVVAEGGLIRRWQMRAAAMPTKARKCSALRRNVGGGGGSTARRGGSAAGRDQPFASRATRSSRFRWSSHHA
ncbi:pyridoxamine 5'-phosphate oxidase family protein [Streptomyces sp. Ru72]|uniref:pyridoxamine 5'-phosphate oxidase family protein n=1 Tax=Streptomyces sp. Ru72 TaxID=2080747 RepID=UPI0035BE4C4A